MKRTILPTVLAAALGALPACTNGAGPTAQPQPQPGPERPPTTGDTDMTRAKKPAAPASPAAAPTGVSRKLLEAGYRELFLRMDHKAVDELWASAAAELDALVRDPGQDHEARFLAAEILFLKAPGFPPPDLRPVLAPLYAEALAQTGRQTGRWRLMANQWGLTYAGDDVGALGPHLLALGDDAIAALRPLLDNAEPVLYEGSRDATTGNARGYRIKDLAAYYLGRLTGTAVAYHPTPAERDREIARLAQRLP